MGNSRGLLGRLALVGAAVVTVVVALAESASAHVDVRADKAQAGATDVTVSFNAESESDTVGIVSLRVVLPAGIAPADVTWLSGPAGWTLSRAADGYTVGGPAVPPGQDAAYQVKIAKLPADATRLGFKTLQTYSDGRVDRWIEIPTPGAAEPDNPAPVLTVAPAAAPATSGPSAASPTVAPSSAPVGTTTAAAAPASGDGSSPWVWIGVAALVLIALASGLLWWRRGRGPVGSPGAGA